MSALPDLQTAEALLQEAAGLNPGPWVEHSRQVARAAAYLAAAHPDLDPQRGYVLGLLHDLGRRTGPNQGRHILDGYDHLTRLGYPDAARVALTHSFVIPDLETLQGAWDSTPEEYRRLGDLLRATSMNLEDRLIQLCDMLGLEDGFYTVQERQVDVAFRYGVDGRSVQKWRATLDLKADFDRACGQNIYRLLPGLTERLLR